MSLAAFPPPPAATGEDRDPVTGLPRLGAGASVLQDLVVRARASGTPVALFHIDIDHFVSTNENMGFEVGDQALALLAERLLGFLGPEGRLWRLVSDEFVAALPLPELGSDPEALAEQLRSQIELPLAVMPYNIYLTASIGVALLPDHALTAGALLARAEMALAQAKHEGLNTARVLHHDDDTRTRGQITLGREMVNAMVNGELRLLYQPKISAQDGRIVGMEALLRWQSPTLGLLTPGRFLHVAEKLGVIVQIGQWVLDTACGQAHDWLERGFDDFSLAVNISTLQLMRPNFVEEVRQSIEAAGVPTGMIELEITENALSRNVSVVRETILALRRLGVRLTLDDFGLGGASLGALSRYPVNKLKIDRSFVSNISIDSADTAIVRAIVAMGHQMNMKVVAQGVETETQLGYLRRNHCDQLQGFLFSEPVSAEEAGEQLRQRYMKHSAFAATRPDHTLLLLDDEENVLRSLVRLFRRDGYQVLTAGNVRDAFDVLATNDVQVILSDQRMSDMSGTEFLGRVKELYPDTMRLVLSGYTDLATVTDAINHGAIYRFLTKPWNDDELREHIRQAFRTHESMYRRPHDGSL